MVVKKVLVRVQHLIKSRMADRMASRKGGGNLSIWSLPREIRDIIYDYALGLRVDFYQDSSQSSLTICAVAVSTTALFLVNRAIANEVGSILSNDELPTLEGRLKKNCKEESIRLRQYVTTFKYSRLMYGFEEANRHLLTARFFNNIRSVVITKSMMYDIWPRPLRGGQIMDYYGNRDFVVTEPRQTHQYSSFALSLMQLPNLEDVTIWVAQTSNKECHRYYFQTAEELGHAFYWGHFSRLRFLYTSETLEAWAYLPLSSLIHINDPDWLQATHYSQYSIGENQMRRAPPLLYVHRELPDEDVSKTWPDAGASWVIERPPGPRRHELMPSLSASEAEWLQYLSSCE